MHSTLQREKLLAIMLTMMWVCHALIFESVQVLTRNIQLFKKKGTRFNFVEDVRRGEHRALPGKSVSVISLVFSSNFVVFLSLLAFSVVILVSCNTILCKVMMNG
jgi:hypothetical protein